MKVHADMSKCQGYGNCAEEAPERFALDEWGYVELLDDGDVPASQEDQARRGVDACPAIALRITP